MYNQKYLPTTLLYYKFRSYNNSNGKNHLGYSIHNDIEAHWDK